MLLSPIGRAADIDQVNVERLKHGIWFGPTLQTLSASSNSNEASVAYRLDALAGVSGGADFWPSEEMGLNLRLTVGAPGKVDGLLGQSVKFARHSGEGAFVYRIFDNARPRSSAWLIHSRIFWVSDIVQEQSPSVIVSRTVIGPLIGLSHERYLTDRLWYRFGVDLGYPFFLREAPTDSGRLDFAFDLRAKLLVVFNTRSQLSYAFESVLRKSRYEHTGEATRFGGATFLESKETEATYSFFVRYALPSMR